jgi:hypothetical protein
MYILEDQESDHLLQLSILTSMLYVLIDSYILPHRSMSRDLRMKRYSIQGDLQCGREENVLDIIMGMHGKSYIVKMLLGSIIDTVVRKSQKTILIVRR